MRVRFSILIALSFICLFMSISAPASEPLTSGILTSESQPTVTPGDTVTVRLYEIHGDSTVQRYFPESNYLNFAVGHGEVLPGLDSAVSGMSLLEEKRVTLSPSEAFGKKDSTLFISFPRSAISSSRELSPGMLIRFRDSSGNIVPRQIIDIHDDHIIVDLNHPLAGHQLDLTIQIVSIKN
jgi:FKBP-type peptidyl-prolyl cis-trans isomerase 2